MNLKYLFLDQVVAGKPGRVETPKRKALRAAVSATIENIRFVSSQSNTRSILLSQELAEVANIQTHSQAAWHQRIQSKTAARKWKVGNQKLPHRNR